MQYQGTMIVVILTIFDQEISMIKRNEHLPILCTPQVKDPHKSKLASSLDSHYTDSSTGLSLV